VTARNLPTRQSSGADWRSQAACGDHNPDLFFPSEDAPAELVRVQEATAKAVCRSCPVAGACLATALTRRMTYGVWGGLSANDRRAVLAARSTSRTEVQPPPPTSTSSHRTRRCTRAHAHRRATQLCTNRTTAGAVTRPDSGPMEVDA
jgi:WhiB family transcriptional regulator, redox-sensing transcriptional regulator